MKSKLISTLLKNPKLQNGMIDQPTKLKKNVNTGAKIKLKVFEFVGITVSFNNNFTPSAAGCKRPRKPTTLGP
jgi:hypothetical protein